MLSMLSLRSKLRSPAMLQCVLEEGQVRLGTTEQRRVVRQRVTTDNCKPLVSN